MLLEAVAQSTALIIVAQEASNVKPTVIVGSAGCTTRSVASVSAFRSATSVPNDTIASVPSRLTAMSRTGNSTTRCARHARRRTCHDRTLQSALPVKKMPSFKNDIAATAPSWPASLRFCCQV